jgi:hypothetical protein
VTEKLRKPLGGGGSERLCPNEFHGDLWYGCEGGDMSEKALSELQNEKDRLTLLKANAALRAEIFGLEAPWWRKASVVTTMTGILAAIIPATTAIQGHFQKERELALAERKQTEDLRTSYLDRMKTPGEHLRTLRFAIATTPDVLLRAWAVEEKKIVEADLQKLGTGIESQREVVRELLRASAATGTTDPQLSLEMKKLLELDLAEQRVHAGPPKPPL